MLQFGFMMTVTGLEDRDSTALQRFIDLLCHDCFDNGQGALAVTVQYGVQDLADIVGSQSKLNRY